MVKLEQLEHWACWQEAVQRPLRSWKPAWQLRQTDVLAGAQSKQLGVLQLKQAPLLGVGTKGGETHEAQREEFVGSHSRQGNLHVEKTQRLLLRM